MSTAKGAARDPAGKRAALRLWLSQACPGVHLSALVGGRDGFPYAELLQHGSFQAWDYLGLNTPLNNDYEKEIVPTPLPPS